MKQQWINALLIITSLFGLAAGARAEAQQEVIVTIPNEFVVAGHKLPAGTYTVSQLSEDKLAALSIVSGDQRQTVLVLPNQFENRPGDDPKIRLEQVGGMYFLRSIETLDGVYTLPLPGSALLLSKFAHADSMSASGTH